MSRERDCCQSGAPPTPVDISNRPGLSRVDYRVGTYSSFRESMIRALSQDRRLDGLTSRKSDDFGIAVLEMWSYVSDVLTFYQERYFNDAFLKTASERESLVQLARLIGYVPGPGLAATVYLAFTLDADTRLELSEPLRTQSAPSPGAGPQKFETVETFEADSRLNRLRL